MLRRRSITLKAGDIMQITFYNMKSPAIKIEKTLGDALSTCDATPDPTGPINIVDPVVVVDKSKIPSNANYARIETLGRYYFITGIDWTIAKTAIVYLHSDVLSNFAGQLGTMNFVRGAASVGEIEDGSYPLGDYLKVERFSFSNWSSNFFTNSSADNRYLLRVADGASRPVSRPMVQLGAGLLYKDQLFTVQGSDVISAYLSDPTTIPLPPQQPYTLAADGSIIGVQHTVGETTQVAYYKFVVHITNWGTYYDWILQDE